MSKEYAVVVLQISSIIYFSTSGPVFSNNIILLFFEIIFIIIGVWAMLEMKLRFNIIPEVINNSRLTTSGPFRYIRNPMYSATLFITLVWLIDHFTIIRLAVWILLLIVLNIKITMEEKYLMEKFHGYERYKARTKRLVPFIY